VSGTEAVRRGKEARPSVKRAGRLWSARTSVECGAGRPVLAARHLLQACGEPFHAEFLRHAGAAREVGGAIRRTRDGDSLERGDLLERAQKGFVLAEGCCDSRAHLLVPRPHPSVRGWPLPS